MRENIRQDVLCCLPNVSSKVYTEKEIGEIVDAMYDYYWLCIEDAENDGEAGRDLFNETFMEHLKEITD